MALIPVAVLTAVMIVWQVRGQQQEAPVAASAEASAVSENTTTEAIAPQRIVLAQADPAGRQFELGEHYERLTPAQPTSSGPEQIEVAEVFWYACPHCYTFDPYLESWKENLSADVNFVRIPVLWAGIHQMHARIYYTAETLNKLDEMHADVFREIHVNRNGLDNAAAIGSFFGNYGVDAATFDSTFESFAVYTKLQRADELARRYRISSVPTIIVNGKYTTSATMAGSYPVLLEVIDELIAMERAGE
jgi:thiol:disulfide interchange protein DsbA